MSPTLAGSGGAVMARGTSTGDTRMVKIHRGPVGGDMAIITHIAGR